MTSITDDILTWSEKYLEPKNEYLGNVPVCPYARTARLKKTYKILECHKHIEFFDTILEGIELAKDPDIQIAIVGCDDIEHDVDELNAVIDVLNKVFVPQDIYLMCSHPYDGEEPEPVEFLETGEWEPANEFIMVLIQKFDELEKASDNLRKTGYYDHWPSDYYEGTVLKRQSYRRYRNGRQTKNGKE
jgi:predicted nucleotidyltransferase